MQFFCYSDWGQLPGHAQPLWSHAQQQSVFLSQAWLVALTNSTLKAPYQLCLLGVQEANKLVALLPLKTADQVHLSSLSHSYSSHFDLLIDPQHAIETILECLANGLQNSGFLSLSVLPVDAQNSHLVALKPWLEKRDFETLQSFRFYNWVYLSSGTSFSAYKQQLPSRLQQTLSRKKRKLEREHQTEFLLLDGDSALQAFSEYEAIYRASWKGEEQFPEVMQTILEAVAAQGWLRLALLRIDQQPAAAQLWFVSSGKACIFRLNYDSHWRHYSPGTLLTGFMMKHVLEHERVQEMDFLMGNEAYKQDWMNQRRERHSITWTLKAKSTTTSMPSWWSRFRSFIR